MASLANKLAANKRFDFKSDAFEADKFAVVNMTGYEAISKPFRFVLTLVSDDADIQFDDVLQAAATLQIFAPDGASSTPYHGVLAEFDQMHQADGYVFYRAVLVPRLWHLSLYQMSEVYLNEQTIPQILEQVLKASRLVGSDYAMKLAGTYRERSFVCQYQETHLDFLSRWMEKEGMYFYFDHDGPTDKLMIVDRLSMHPAEAVKVFYRPVNEQDTGSAPDSVQDFVCRQKPLPKQLVLRDFNHRKASVELKVTETVSANGIGEVNLYGENFRNEAEGQRYAKLRAEEIRCGARVFNGDATAVGLRSGYFMELARHYRENFNGKYLVTEVQHEGSQAAALLAGIKTEYGDGKGETVYRSTFRAIPADVQFRQERTTQRPRVSGTMNATIDAAGLSPYAELDEYGQYKVQLPFDSSDKAAGKGSARVRMASPYSGSDHGMNFPLHKNAEVLLSFIDGNPDEPVILGAVPNSENVSIVNQLNPYENKITTAGGNLIHMGDQKGKEVMWLHSPFHNSTIGLGSVDPKGGGSIMFATGGNSESITVGAKNDLFLGFKNAVTVATDSSLSAALTNKFSFGNSVDFSWSNDVTWKKGKSITLDDSTSYTLKDTGKYLGGESTWIAGGQRMLVKKLVDDAKDVVKKAVMYSAAVQFAAAIASGGLVAATIADDKKDSAEKGKASDPWDNGVMLNAARVIGVAGGAVTAGLVNYAMNAAATTVAAAGSTEEVYASNIKMGRSGIDIGVDDVSLVNKGSIAIKDQSVLVKVRGDTSLEGSSIKVSPVAIWLNARNLAGLGGSTSLHSGVTVATSNPKGEIQLTHPNKVGVKLSATGLVANSGTSKLNLTLAAGATLEGGPVSKVSVLPAEVTAKCGVAKLTLNPTMAELLGPGCKATFGASGAKINGVLIQLG